MGPQKCGREEKRSMVMKVIEHTEGHYEAQDVEFGRVYRWYPETLVIVCDCGERSILCGSATTCGRCGLDHAVAVREDSAAGRLGDEALHPWRYAEDPEDTGVSF